MKKLSLFPVLFISLIFASCPLLFKDPEKIYPNDIDIPGYGKLVYTKTLFDGKDIKDAVINGNIVWSLDYFSGKVYRYNTQTRQTSTFDIEKQNSATGESAYTMCLYRLIELNDDLYIFVKNNTDNKNYTAKINKTGKSLSYTKMPDLFDGLSFGDGYLYNNTVYFRMTDNNFDALPYRTSDFVNYTPVTSDEFRLHASAATYTDSTNRQYKIIDHSVSRTETYLSVSVDNGITWFNVDMGTNFANRVLVVDDTVYVSCHKYYEVIGFIPTGSAGGGLHVFSWQ
jgi:hypothetical protein